MMVKVRLYNSVVNKNIQIYRRCIYQQYSFSILCQFHISQWTSNKGHNNPQHLLHTLIIILKIDVINKLTIQLYGKRDDYSFLTPIPAITYFSANTVNSQSHTLTHFRFALILIELLLWEWLFFFFKLLFPWIVRK